jgi:hypothetical protein
MKSAIRRAFQSASDSSEQPAQQARSIDASMLLGELRETIGRSLFPRMVRAGVPYHEVKRAVADAYLATAVEVCGGNKSAAGRAVKKHRNRLVYGRPVR